MMKVLLVSNQHQNNLGLGNPIMYRMRDSLAKSPHLDSVEFLPFCNSLASLSKIRFYSKEYDIVHVHFGGLYALLIWLVLLGVNVKKVITFHGTDIHAKAIRTAKKWSQKFKIKINQKASFVCITLYDACGFVASSMMDYIPFYMSSILEKKAFIQSLGVDYTQFKIEDKSRAQKELGLSANYKYVLFSDVSNTSIKRRDIAESIVECLGNDYSLLIMSGVLPQIVPTYINACDFILITSDEEGSPNIVREALALNKPVFSVQVGDVAMQLKGLNNSRIISRDPIDAAKSIQQALSLPYSDNTRETLRNHLDFDRVNADVVDLYLDLNKSKAF